MIRYINYKDARSVQAVVMVKWSPSGSERVTASIETIIHTGEPTETTWEIKSIAVDESMTRQGMEERAKDIAKHADISNICFHPALAS